MGKKRKVRGNVGITRFQSLCFSRAGHGWIPVGDLAAVVDVKERTIRRYCESLNIEVLNGKADFNQHLF